MVIMNLHVVLVAFQWPPDEFKYLLLGIEILGCDAVDYFSTF